MYCWVKLVLCQTRCKCSLGYCRHHESVGPCARWALLPRGAGEWPWVPDHPSSAGWPVPPGLPVLRGLAPAASSGRHGSSASPVGDRPRCCGSSGRKGRGPRGRHNDQRLTNMGADIWKELIAGASPVPCLWQRLWSKPSSAESPQPNVQRCPSGWGLPCRLLPFLLTVLPGA